MCFIVLKKCCYSWKGLSRVGNSLFHSSLFRSKSLFLKSDHERLALVDLLKRATVSKSLSLDFTKEWLWANRCSRSLQKSDTSELLLKKESREWFDLLLSKTERSLQKISCFWEFFTAFPLFMPMSELLPLLFAPSLSFKEQLDRFTLVTLYKRATVNYSLFFKSKSLFRFFAHKKRTIARKAKSEFPTLGLRQN